MWVLYLSSTEFDPEAGCAPHVSDGGCQMVQCSQHLASAAFVVLLSGALYRSSNLPCSERRMCVIGAVPVQKHLPARWKALVTRDNNGMPSRKGQVWASPYRWGCTLIAYRKGDLLRSALSHTISIILTDDPYLAAL